MHRIPALGGSIIAVFGLLTLAVLVWPGSQVEAAAIAKRWGFVGLTPGQTARIAIINLGDRGCQGSVAWFSLDGAQLKFGSGDIAPGQVRGLDFEAVLPARVEIRAVLTLEDPGARACADQVIPSIEVFDTDTGKTTFGLFPPPVQ